VLLPAFSTAHNKTSLAENFAWRLRFCHRLAWASYSRGQFSPWSLTIFGIA